MAKRIDGDAGGEIKIFAVLDIPHVTTLPLLKHRRWSHIGRDHVWELLVHESGSLRAWRWVGCRQRRFTLAYMSVFLQWLRT